MIHLFDHTHLQPKDSHGVDFSRVRMWSLNGWSKFYCQTLVFTDFLTPEINSLFSTRCKSIQNKHIHISCDLHIHSYSHSVCMYLFMQSCAQTITSLNIYIHAYYICRFLSVCFYSALTYFKRTVNVTSFCMLHSYFCKHVNW